MLKVIGDHSVLAFQAKAAYDVPVNGTGRECIHVEPGMYMVVIGPKREFVTEEEFHARYPVVEEINVEAQN